ncbi:MAG: hypothetical protein ACRDD7_11170, partial [Peptostreptococcaceae bacterium]
MSKINEILNDIEIPKVVKVKQKFDKICIENPEEELYKRLIEKNINLKINKGDKIAITAGSRGISHYEELMKVIVHFVKEYGGVPFIVPSMGSHGGATSIGQEKMLEKLGITEENVGAPIVSDMEVIEIGKSDKNLPVY